jgi:hypothetical protein
VRKQSNVSQKSNSKKTAAKKANPETEEEDEGAETGPSELFVGNMAFATDENSIR